MSDDNELPDEEAVELSHDLRRAIEEEAQAKAQAATVADAADDDDEADADDDAGEDVADAGGADDSDDDEGDDTASDGVKPKRPSGSARERIAELAKKRREAEKAAFDAEMKVIELERRLSEREVAVKEAPKEPKPSDFTYGEVDPDYLDAVVEHKVALREQEIRAKAEQSTKEQTAAQAAAHYRDRLAEVMAAGKKRFKNFDEAINGTNFEPDLARMVLDSEKAVDIAYHLSNNISDLRDMTKATGAERARMLGRLEGRYSAASAVKKKSSAPDAPGTRGSKPVKEADAKYGPDDQDAFDRAFFG